MMTDIKHIPLIDVIIPANRARSYDQLKAQALAGSIAAQGLFHPITVRPIEGGYVLVSGLHRFRAVEQTGADTIEARVSDLSDDEARLAEVMENLARGELIALDRCQHLYELKVVYEQMYPETRAGVAGANAKHGSANEIFSFAEHVAEQIGLSQRAIQIAVAIWKGLSKDTPPPALRHRHCP